MANSSPIFWQQLLTLPPMSRGFHRIDAQLEALLQNNIHLSAGLVHLFLQHTSASLVITENCCADVRRDLEEFYNQLAPDSIQRYQHNMEGPDDMPAHIKSTLLGVNLTLPIENGRFALGQWQGVYLGEHRDKGTARRILVTAYGLSAP
ncbi:secondary thiamine-phosphate synthase enzyme YjbQ [Legionella sp. W05-934-2]|uniref:secondary thiamine-phosphate synthase enzyme YjbQ n=1 Tax=Legionella sp. W05-934-2 TaxID=1198649 RepID=UPI003462BB30